MIHCRSDNICQVLALFGKRSNSLITSSHFDASIKACNLGQVSALAPSASGQSANILSVMIDNEVLLDIPKGNIS